MDVSHFGQHHRGRRDVHSRHNRLHGHSKKSKKHKVSCRNFGEVLFGIEKIDICWIMDLIFDSPFASALAPIIGGLNATLLQGQIPAGCPFSVNL